MVLEDLRQSGEALRSLMYYWPITIFDLLPDFHGLAVYILAQLMRLANSIIVHSCLIQAHLVPFISHSRRLSSSIGVIVYRLCSCAVSPLANVYSLLTVCSLVRISGAQYVSESPSSVASCWICSWASPTDSSSSSSSIASG